MNWSTVDGQRGARTRVFIQHGPEATLSSTEPRARWTTNHLPSPPGHLPSHRIPIHPYPSSIDTSITLYTHPRPYWTAPNSASSTPHSGPHSIIKLNRLQILFPEMVWDMFVLSSCPWPAGGPLLQSSASIGTFITARLCFIDPTPFQSLARKDSSAKDH